MVHGPTKAIGESVSGCYLVFKGPQCGYKGIAHTCNKTVQRCVQLKNIINFRGWPPIEVSMEKENLVCFARVQLTVEIELAQPWSHDETLKNLYDQAKRQALQMTEVNISKFGRIIDTPKVTAILVPNDGKR